MKTTAWFRRNLMVSFLLCLCTVLFAAAQEEEKKASITVTDWWAESASGQGVYAKAIDKAFTEKYPNIQLQHEGGFETPYDVITAALIAKEGSDVYMMHANGQRFQDLGDGFVVLDDYIQDMFDDFPQSTLADCSPDRDISKGIRGLPVTVQGWLWYYNKELFKQAGLDPENEPDTWESFLETCEALKAAGFIPLGFGKGIHLEWMIAGTLDQVLSLEELRGLLKGSFLFTDPKCINTFAKFRELWKRGYMDAEGLTVPLLMEATNKFMAGGSVIFRGLVSDIACWKDLGDAIGPDNLGMFPNFYFEPSAHRDVIGVAGGVAYAVPKYSKNKEAAIKWVKYTASPEGAEILLRETGGIPATNKADKSKVANQVGEKIMNYVAHKSVPVTKAFTTTPQWNVLRSHAPLMITGELTPEEFGIVLEEARE